MLEFLPEFFRISLSITLVRCFLLGRMLTTGSTFYQVLSCSCYQFLHEFCGIFIFQGTGLLHLSLSNFWFMELFVIFLYYLFNIQEVCHGTFSFTSNFCDLCLLSFLLSLSARLLILLKFLINQCFVLLMVSIYCCSFKAFIEFYSNLYFFSLCFYFGFFFNLLYSSFSSFLMQKL